MSSPSPTSNSSADPDAGVTYVEPTSTLDIDQWRNAGFCLTHGILPEDLINQAAEDVTRHSRVSKDDFGGVLFPTPNAEALNQLVLHPILLEAVKKLLGTEEIRLTQADAWSKTGAAVDPSKPGSNQDQRVHIDGHNHIFVTMPAWEQPVAVAMIVYLSDYVGGGTGVVPREGEDDPAYAEGKNLLTPGGACEYPWINDKSSAESWMESHATPEVVTFRRSLYAREKVAHYKKGTVLFYRHDIWHRGRPLHEGKTRLVLNLSYRRADCDYWVNWNPGWPQSNYHSSQYVERLLVSLSVDQRTVLGFPAPGHRYWTKRTLKEVEARYKHLGFDITPYQKEAKL